jgi:hypothetical protein
MPNCVHHTLQITFTTHSAVEYLIFLLEQCTCPSWLSSHQNGSNSRYKQKSGQYCCRVPSTRPGQGRSQAGVRHGSSTQAEGLLRCGLSNYIYLLWWGLSLISRRMRSLGGRMRSLHGSSRYSTWPLAPRPDSNMRAQLDFLFLDSKPVQIYSTYT